MKTITVTFPSATTLSLSCTLTFTKSAFCLTEPLGLWLLSNFKWSGPYWFPFVAYTWWPNHYNWSFLRTQSLATCAFFCLVCCKGKPTTLVFLSRSLSTLRPRVEVFSVHQVMWWRCWVSSDLTQSWHHLPGGRVKSHGLLTQTFNPVLSRCQSRVVDPQVTEHYNFPTNWIFIEPAPPLG